MPAHEHNPSPIEEEIEHMRDHPSQYMVDFPFTESDLVREAKRNVGRNWPTVFSECLDSWMHDKKVSMSQIAERHLKAQEPGAIKLLLGHDEWQAWQYYVSITPHFRVETHKDDPWFGRSVYQGVELFHVDRKSLWLFL